MNRVDLDLDAEWKPKQPEASELFYRARLAETRLSPERDFGLEVELLSLSARCEAAQGNRAKAELTLDEAEALLEEGQGTYRISARIRWLIERGRLYITENTPARARALFAEGWTLAVNSGEDFFTVEIARTMAQIDPMKAQEEWLRIGIEVAERSAQAKTKGWLGGLYAALAWKLFELRQFDRALEAHQCSAKSFREAGNEEEARLAQWSVGRVLRELGRYEEALGIQRSLLGDMRAGAPAPGRLCEELAECLLALKKPDEARSYFVRAYETMSADGWVSDGQPLQLKRLKKLAGLG